MLDCVPNALPRLDERYRYFADTGWAACSNREQRASSNARAEDAIQIDRREGASVAQRLRFAKRDPLGRPSGLRSTRLRTAALECAQQREKLTVRREPAVKADKSAQAGMRVPSLAPKEIVAAMGAFGIPDDWSSGAAIRSLPRYDQLSQLQAVFFRNATPEARKRRPRNPSSRAPIRAGPGTCI